jgi:hypothetical protein
MVKDPEYMQQLDTEHQEYEDNLIFKDIYDNLKALGVLTNKLQRNTLDVINVTGRSLTQDESNYNKILSLLYPTNDSSEMYSTLGEILNARQDGKAILEHFLTQEQIEQKVQNL